MAISSDQVHHHQHINWHLNICDHVKVIGTTAGIIAASSSPAAWAAEKPQYTGAKAGFDNRPKRSSAFRGGQEAAASTHDGTDLNDAEASVAGGLLEKMGLADEKGANDRSSDRRKAYGSK